MSLDMETAGVEAWLYTHLSTQMDRDQMLL